MNRREMLTASATTLVTGSATILTDELTPLPKKLDRKFSFVDLEDNQYGFLSIQTRFLIKESKTNQFYLKYGHPGDYNINDHELISPLSDWLDKNIHVIIRSNGLFYIELGNMEEPWCTINNYKYSKAELAFYRCVPLEHEAGYSKYYFAPDTWEKCLELPKVQENLKELVDAKAMAKVFCEKYGGISPSVLTY